MRARGEPDEIRQPDCTRQPIAEGRASRALARKALGEGHLHLGAVLEPIGQRTETKQ